MNRSPMPPRRQQMKRNRPPTRKGPSRPPAKVKRRAEPDREFWGNQRSALYDRSKGRCERCGVDLNKTGMEAHHRKLRSQGGGHSLSNLLALCPDCHRWCHANPDDARSHGWIIRAVSVPAIQAVTLWDHRTVLLTPEGDYTVVFATPEETA